MTSRWQTIVGLSMLLAIALEQNAWADLPKTATLATPAAGSLYNAIGVGLATVISRHSPMTVRVQTSAGPPAWLPSMESGDTDLGVLTSADAVTSYKGIVIYKKRFRNTRILAVGGSLKLGFYVANNSEIQNLSDLKGKKIPADFPGAPIVKLSSTAALATAGLTYNDIVKVPVADLNAGAQAFLEGRTVLDLGVERAGGAERQHHPVAGGPFEVRGDDLHGRGEVGGDGDLNLTGKSRECHDQQRTGGDQNAESALHC